MDEGGCGLRRHPREATRPIGDRPPPSDLESSPITHRPRTIHPSPIDHPPLTVPSPDHHPSEPEMTPTPRPGRAPISVIVPVKNEAENLRRCLPALAWADEVIV